MVTGYRSRKFCSRIWIAPRSCLSFLRRWRIGGYNACRADEGGNEGTAVPPDHSLEVIVIPGVNVAIVPNHTKRQLAAGELALGMGVRNSRTVDIATVARTCDFDWLFIDMEHSSLDVDLASQLAMASLGAGITPIVRVPGHEHYHATRLLDNGAQGIVVPHVDTVEEAQRIASACRYPPQGKRSVAGAAPQFGFRNVPLGEATRLMNEETLVIAMLETPEAIANADAIAQVAGIDVLLIGTNDLCAEMGIPAQFADARVESAYKTVIA